MADGGERAAEAAAPVEQPCHGHQDERLQECRTSDPDYTRDHHGRRRAFAYLGGIVPGPKGLKLYRLVHEPRGQSQQPAQHHCAYDEDERQDPVRSVDETPERAAGEDQNESERRQWIQGTRLGGGCVDCHEGFRSLDAMPERLASGGCQTLL